MVRLTVVRIFSFVLRSIFGVEPGEILGVESEEDEIWEVRDLSHVHCQSPACKVAISPPRGTNLLSADQLS